MDRSSLLHELLELYRHRVSDLPLFAAGGVVFTLAFVWLAPWAQRMLPQLWPRNAADRESVVTDAIYLGMGTLSALLGQTLVTAGVVAGAVIIGHKLDLTLLDGFGPVVRQPYWLMVVEMYVLSDAISYWTHRMAHTIPCLWRLHATHHSTQHMVGLSFARFHLLEVWELVPNLTLLFLLGFPVDALAALGVSGQLYAFYLHSTLPPVPRWLSYVINSSAFHRWHHSKEFSGVGHNFSSALPVMDLLFGTYHYPKHAPAEFGIEDSQMPKTYLKQLVYPFRRTRSTSSSERLGLAQAR